MRILTSGSIASDHLFTFSGLFSDSLVPESLHRISTSFLADGLQVQRGGVAANISYGMSQLGCASVLYGAVGEDFSQYQADYTADAPHVDMSHILTVTGDHTARFTCTTDSGQNQIGTFFPGAMTGARQQTIAAVHQDSPVDLVVLSPNDPEAMHTHVAECRDLGIPYLSDPSQQVSSMSEDLLRDLVDGAEYLFCNEYEADVIQQRTGLSQADIISRVGVMVMTRGAEGSEWMSEKQGTFHTGAVSLTDIVDPTGGGDAFRAGFLAGLTWDLEPQRRCEIGAVLASFCVQAAGPQNYRIDKDAFVTRMGATFGDTAADTVRQCMSA